MGKHLFIAGHGMQQNGTFDPGATGYITKGEHKYAVEDVFEAMKKFLPKNHNIVFFSKYKVSNYGNIVSLARSYGATEITEVHYDAASPSARRGHVIVHKNYSPDKTDLALRDAIKNVVGVRYSHKGHEGISGRDNLFNANQTARAKITYRLIELGFGTNKDDANIMVEDIEEYGKQLVQAVLGNTNNNTTVKKKSTSKPKPKPKQQSTRYTKDAKWPKLYNKGPNVGKWQGLLKDLGYYTGLIDNSFGPATDKATRAFQRANGLTVDGQAGPASNSKANELLNVNIRVDGFGGPLTIRASQRYFGTPVDGIVSKPSLVIKALQRFLNGKGAKLVVDGYFGPLSIKALQRYFGTPVDGHLSKPSLVIKELQRRLNKGKL